MEMKIERAHGGELDQYKVVLDKYHATYHQDRGSYFAVVILNEVDKIFSLSKELEEDLIVSRFENRMTIYDDCME